MAYLRAALLGLVVAIALGAAMGFRESLIVGRGNGTNAETRATVYAVGIATGVNCAALCSLLFVPSAIAILFVKGRVGRGQ